jgi:hypothetical protein
VNFGECGKSSGRHSLTSTVKRGLTVSLTKGSPQMCVDLVKGFIGVHWRGFRGDDPGWPRFDRCLAGLTRLIRSLALMTVIKNLGRHMSPARTRVDRGRRHTTAVSLPSPRRHRQAAPIQGRPPFVLAPTTASPAAPPRPPWPPHSKPPPCSP